MCIRDRSVADDGIHNLTTQPLAKSLLLREPPKHTGGSLQLDGESVLDAAIRITRTMNSDVLAIQGPPGTGKTYTGANIILDLVASGKRVGVTAVSNKAIDALLDKVVEVAEERGQDITCFKKGTARDDYDGPVKYIGCLLYTSPSPRDRQKSRMPSSA